MFKLSMSQVLQILVNADIPGDRVVHPKVPIGSKDNVYYLVDNAKNVERRRDGLNNIFDDDCGAWKSSTARSVKHPYMTINNKQTRLFWIASMNKYCKEKK
jgi:hypothetical protein